MKIESMAAISTHVPYAGTTQTHFSVCTHVKCFYPRPLRGDDPGSLLMSRWSSFVSTHVPYAGTTNKYNRKLDIVSINIYHC